MKEHNDNYIPAVRKRFMQSERRDEAALGAIMVTAKQIPMQASKLTFVLSFLIIL